MPNPALLSSILISAALALTACGVARAGVDSAETFDAEANPTGNPIGGGEGYQSELGQADYTVGTAEELGTALAEAKTGEVICQR